MKPAITNKKSTSFSDLVADSELQVKTIQIGHHDVVIREMTGRQRFELSDRGDAPRWDTLLWVAFNGIVDPAPTSIEDFEGLKTEWIIKIANAVLAISGLETDASDEAENESASVTGIGGS